MYIIENTSDAELTILLMDSKVMFNDRVRETLKAGSMLEIQDEQYCPELRTLEKKNKVKIHYFEDTPIVQPTVVTHNDEEELGG